VIQHYRRAASSWCRARFVVNARCWTGDGRSRHGRRRDGIGEFVSFASNAMPQGCMAGGFFVARLRKTAIEYPSCIFLCNAWRQLSSAIN
jgi:hypothetical protein